MEVYNLFSMHNIYIHDTQDQEKIKVKYTRSWLTVENLVGP